MLLPASKPFVIYLKKLSNRFDIAVACIGILVLAGWLWDIQFLKSIASNWPVMRPIAAVSFILCAYSSFTSKPGETKFTTKSITAGYIFAWIVLVGSILEIAEYYVHWRSTVGNMLLYGRTNGSVPQHAKMSLTSVCFLFMSLTLIVTRHSKNYALLQMGIFFIAFPSFVGMLDYMFWAKDAYMFGFEKMALHAASCFFLLSLSLLFSRPEEGWMSIVSSDSLGGTVIRKLLLRILLLLLVLSELRYTAQRFKVIDVETGIIFSTIIAVVLISFAMLRVAKYLGTEDVKRRMAEQSMESLNKSLVRRTEQLEASNAELELMINIASHDLTEPAKTISSYSDLIIQKYSDKLDKNAIVYFNFLKDGARRMKTVIKDVLTYGSVNKNVTMQECNGNEVLKEVLEELAELITETKTKITAASLPTFHCHKDIKLVFTHMIRNAIKFRKEKIAPEITISFESKGNKWQFMIQDNGIGIKNQYFEKIFEPFQTLYPKDRYEGSGIGLAICKKIIEFQEGEIWVTSTPDIGSTFYFTVPKVPGSGSKTDLSKTVNTTG